jgi:hypothetical protein
MQLSRRTFIASLTGALVAPRLALPAPPPGMRTEVAPELVAFREVVDDSIVFVRSRVVLFGTAARAALNRDPHLWSAVMVDRRVA